MSSVLTSNLQTGGAQFQAALANSQNAINALLRQAGVTGDTSGYSAAGAVGGGGAPTLGTLSYGPEGAFSEAYQAGGNIAAEQAMQSRSRGLGTGGLAAQRQELALMQTRQGAGDVTRALAEGIGTQYGAAQQADVDERIRMADAAKKLLRMWLLLLVALQILSLLLVVSLVVLLLLVLPQNPELSLTN
jgi:hypothetical protein